MSAFCFGALKNIKYFYVLPAYMSSNDAALKTQATSIKIGGHIGLEISFNLNFSNCIVTS